MALTRITKGVIKPNENYDTHNINSTGIVTSVGLDVNGNADISGSLSVGGVLTYEDVTSIDSVGIITAQSDIHVGGGVSVVGVGSFGSLDIGGDIDVDGHTNLDNVSIAGVTTFSDDVYFDGATANRDIIFDRSANTLQVKPNAKIKLGQGSYSTDLYTDGTNTIFDHNTASGLFVKANIFQVYGTGTSGSNTYDGTIFRCIQGKTELGYEVPNGGATTLDNLVTSEKGVTVGTGVTIERNGNSNFVGVSSLGTGDTGAVYLYNPADDELSATTNDDYGWKAKTYKDGLQINSKLYLSRTGSNGLALTYNNATGSYITANSGFLRLGVPYGGYFNIYSNQIWLKDRLQTTTFALFEKVNNSLWKSSLYSNNQVKLNIEPSGISVVGTTTSTQLAVTGVSTFSGNIIGAAGVDLNLDSTLGNSSSTAFSGFDGRLVFDTTFSDTARGPNKIQLQNTGGWVGGFGISSNTLDIYTGGITAFRRSTDTNTYTTQMSLDHLGNLSPSGDVRLSSSVGSNSSTAVTDAAWSRLEFDTDYSDSARGPNKIVLQHSGNWFGGFGISSNSMDVYTGGILHFYGKANTADSANIETLAKFTTDGAAELYDNNELKLSTNYEGITVRDTTSTQSMVKMNTSSGFAGSLYGVGNSVIALLRANLQWGIKVNSGGATELYHTGNAKKLETTSTGISLNQDLDVDGHTNLDNVSIAGVTTFTGDATFNGGAGAIRIPAASDIRFTTGNWTGESVKIQYHNDKFYWQTGANGWQFRDAAGAATLELSPAGVISGKDLTFSSEIKANNGAGAIRILGGSDIRFNTGNWTGEFSGKLQYHSDKFYWQTGANGWQFRDSSGTATLELSPAGAISGKTLTFAQDVSFSGGGGGCTIASGSDIRLGSGAWTGNAYGKIQHHNNHLYFGGGSSGDYSFIFRYNSSDKIYIKSNGTIWPQADSTSDLGLNDKRWANVYADTYYGDGSNLTGVTMTTINNNSNNYVITGTGTANTLQGESALTFSSGRLHSGAITLNDNGVSGALLNVRTDDQGPWAFVIGNDTYHASSGLYGYQPNNGDFLLRLVGNSEYKSFTFEQHNGSSNRSWAEFGNGGNVKLFYQGNERLATTTSGLTMGGTGAFIPPIGTTGERPSGSTGMVRYNSTTGQLEVYNGSAWVNVNSQPFDGSGGSESLSSRSGYKVHTFTSPGTFTVTGDDTSKVVEVLVIGGGGAGGEGGGGAGALRFSNSHPLTPGNYAVTIGGGGSGNQSQGNNGSSSSFGNITAPGGGGGGGSSRGNGNPGGSGGGGRRDNGGSRGNAAGSSGGSNNSNSPSSGWGNRGGSGNVSNWCGGGGGGGAGSVGGQGNGGNANAERGGPGGSGLAYSINGSSTTRAGGGGGGCEGSGGPSGPGRATSVNGGGGRGGVSNQVPGSFGAQAGTSNTGGGGGGNASTGYSGGNHSGGSGIVIVAYTI